MSDTTAYEYIENTGVIVPDTSTVLTEVEGEFTGVFGTGLNLDSSTPQGVLIAGETLARSNVIQNNAGLANQINPNQSEGVFLDAVCALTGLEREADTYTTVTGTLTGVGNSPIAAGSLAATEAGDQFALSASVTLSASGSGTGVFVAVEPGPIACGTGDAGLTTIISDALGWETVSNSGSATLGTVEQTDQALRTLRANTLALQGTAIMEAILSAISNLPGVIGRQGRENYTSEPATIDGIYLLANSVWVCVDGGTPAGIATALLQNKSMGANWNGAQSLSIVEPVSGQTYTVLWDIPTPVPLLAQITVRQGSFVGNPTAAVIQAAVDFANNNIQPANPADTPVPGFSVGVNASPFDMSAGILQECPGLQIKLLQFSLASGSPSFSPMEIEIALNQKATVTADDVNVILVT